MTNKVVLVKENPKAVGDRQKSYADNRRKPLEFEVGDRVMLKVSPWKGDIHFGIKGKLAPRRWTQISPLLSTSPTVIAGNRVLGSAAAAFQSSLHHEDHEQEVLAFASLAKVISYVSPSVVSEETIPHHRHPDLVITDLKPPASSYSQAYVQRLSAFVVKLHDMPGGYGYALFFMLGRMDWIRAAINDAIPTPTPQDVAVSTPNTKVLAKVEASKKRRASTFVRASSQVAKRTRSAMAHSSGSSARLNLFDDSDSSNEESDDDDDAYVEISLITPICSAATIPIRGNHSGGSAPSAVKDSRGKAIMNDVVDIPSGSADRELLARYRGLLKSHDKYVQSTDSRLKSFRQRFTSFQGLESKVSGLKKQVANLNDKVITSDAAFIKDKAKGKEQKKKIKSLSKSLNQFTAEAARLASDLNQARSWVSKFLPSDEFSRVQGEILSLAASVGFERGLNMDRTQEQLATTLIKIWKP
ncbi:hypothetical protein Tco_0782011 [Tanacetum coccineum]